MSVNNIGTGSQGMPAAKSNNPLNPYQTIVLPDNFFEIDSVRRATQKPPVSYREGVLDSRDNPSTKGR